MARQALANGILSWIMTEYNAKVIKKLVNAMEELESTDKKLIGLKL